ncbi:hypothetical protein Aperf_G00000059323 [Anoplocephala perfoliata]
MTFFFNQSGVRCRAFAERIFRGHNFGVVSVPRTYQPDWRLLSIEEGKKLQKLALRKESYAVEVPVKCVAPMPPILAVKLRNLGKISQSVIEAAKKAVPPGSTPAVQESGGYLLLTKLPDEPTLFQVPIEPTAEEKSRVFPDYASQVTKPLPDGLIRKNDAATARDVYYIRRSDTPGIRWRVELADANVEDELLQPTPSLSPALPSKDAAKAPSPHCK